MFIEELDNGFVNSLVINLQARFYSEGSTIFYPGEKVYDMLFVISGQMSICEPNGKQEPFCIIPIGSYFGDYQILKFMPCLYLVKSAPSFKVY